MADNQDTALYDMAFAFSVKLVNIYRYMSTSKREFMLSRHLLRCGTAVGASLAEAAGAATDERIRDRLSEAHEKCVATEYWLSLLKATGFVDEKAFEGLFEDLNILKTAIRAALPEKEDIPSGS